MSQENRENNEKNDTTKTKVNDKNKKENNNENETEKTEIENENETQIQKAKPKPKPKEREKEKSETCTEIMKIFNNFKCSRIILSHLRLSHIVSLSFLSKSFNNTIKKYYGDCTELDLSEYYGVIGSPEFDHQTFITQFLPKFKSVRSLSLRYCSHLKAVHLDNILEALSCDNSNSSGNEEGSQISKLNLYFCSRLGSRSLWKISSRLQNLEYLNLARCYAITAEKNINGLKALGVLPIQTLAISLDPSIQRDEAIDVYSLLSDEDSFRSLKILDLSHGCEILHELEDLSDLTQIRKIQIIKPAKHNK